jgi:hypothetical protein
MSGLTSMSDRFRFQRGLSIGEERDHYEDRLGWF